MPIETSSPKARGKSPIGKMGGFPKSPKLTQSVPFASPMWLVQSQYYVSFRCTCFAKDGRTHPCGHRGDITRHRIFCMPRSNEERLETRPMRLMRWPRLPVPGGSWREKSAPTGAFLLAPGRRWVRAAEWTATRERTLRRPWRPAERRCGRPACCQGWQATWGRA